MAQRRAPSAARPGPFSKEDQAKTNSKIRIEHRNSDTPHDHDLWVYLTDVLVRLPIHPNHQIDELLPHRRTRPAGAEIVTDNRVNVG